MFTDSELSVIEEITKKLRERPSEPIKVHSAAHYFFIHNAVGSVDLATEAWVSSVVQYLMVSGYEIKKRQ